MRWKDRVIDAPLVQGNLMILGDDPHDKNSQLTPKNLQEIVEAVKNGQKDYKNVLYTISRLTLSQVNLPKSASAFRSFLQALLAIPHFTELDFGTENSISCILSQEQTAILGELVSTAQHLKTLKVRVADTAASSQALAAMIRTNLSLNHFWCDITDDAHGYTLLKAALATNNALTTLELKCTAFNSLTPLPIPRSEIQNSHLQIAFESNRSLNTARLAPAPTFSLASSSRIRPRDEGSDDTAELAPASQRPRL